MVEIPAPAPAFMLDVAETQDDGSLRVVELNSFSCSSLYAADPVAVVEAIEALAMSLTDAPQA